MLWIWFLRLSTYAWKCIYTARLIYSSNGLCYTSLIPGLLGITSQLSVIQDLPWALTQCFFQDQGCANVWPQLYTIWEVYAKVIPSLYLSCLWSPASFFLPYWLIVKSLRPQRNSGPSSRLSSVVQLVVEETGRRKSVVTAPGDGRAGWVRGASCQRKDRARGAHWAWPWTPAGFPDCVSGKDSILWGYNWGFKKCTNQKYLLSRLFVKDISQKKEEHKKHVIFSSSINVLELILSAFYVSICI